MRRTIRRSNQGLEFLNTRLDEVRMSSYERQRAKTSLARAEALVDAAAVFFSLAKRLLTALIVRPVRRLAHLAG